MNTQWVYLNMCNYLMCLFGVCLNNSIKFNVGKGVLQSKKKQTNKSNKWDCFLMVPQLKPVMPA
jgi:hypothetical protein